MWACAGCRGHLHDTCEAIFTGFQFICLPPKAPGHRSMPSCAIRPFVGRKFKNCGLMSQVGLHKPVYCNVRFKNGSRLCAPCFPIRSAGRLKWLIMNGDHHR